MKLKKYTDLEKVKMFKAERKHYFRLWKESQWLLNEIAGWFDNHKVMTQEDYDTICEFIHEEMGELDE